VLERGTRLGGYEVLVLLGKGGMGEVYRARDTKLGRDVALKLLPAAFTGDPERIARFKREAQVLAALNHPNIAGIYGIDEADGQQFLALELVDGETLDARLRTRLPIDEALAIARDIVEALEAAHDRGIVHRDLKPANIALTAEGRVKILDFGLAKALEPSGAVDASMSPTITFAATQAGVILGTAAYMSPEQAKGRQVDKRTDIWAFGCVLFEMLTGKRAFEGDDVSDTLAAILRADADWDSLPAALSPAHMLLLRRCLEKDRRKRIGDASTIRFLLDEPLGAAGSAADAPASAAQGMSARRKWTLAAAAMGLAASAAAAGALVVSTTRPRPAPPIVARFPIRLGEGQLFTNTGDLTIAMSPDGSQIAYSANQRLYLRSLSDLDAQPIRGTEVNPRHPMFSPDGRSIAYFVPEERALKRVAVTGGAPVTVSTTDSPNAPFGGSWSGDALFFGQVGGSGHGVVRVPASGGRMEVVVKTKPDEIADAPQLLPDGDHLLFSLARGVAADRWQKSQIVVQSLSTGERKVLVEGGSDGRYLKTGHLLYALGGVVFAIRFDAARLAVVGGPVAVIEGVRRSTGGTQTGIAQLSVSDTGSLAYIPGPLGLVGGQYSIMLVDRDGAVQVVKIPPGPYRDPRVSPDGKRLAVGTEDVRESIVWLYELSGASSMQRLTLGGNNRYPVWAPDGSRVAYQSDREGDAAVFVQRTDGTGKAERLTKPEPGATHVPESWSPDGKWLLFTAVKESSMTSMVLSLDDRSIVPYGDIRSAQPVNAVFSPDGKWVAYSARSGMGVGQIFVQPFPATGEIHQISKASSVSAAHPFWSRDGRQLYYIPGPGQFAAVEVTTRPAFAFTDPRPLSRGPSGFIIGGPTNTRQNDSTPDGRVVAVVDTSASQASAAGVTTNATPVFIVVLNWVEELKARVAR
jgi:eukaryotic-like serine/threonine-protein kinase